MVSLESAVPRLCEVCQTTFSLHEDGLQKFMHSVNCDRKETTISNLNTAYSNNPAYSTSGTTGKDTEHVECSSDNEPLSKRHKLSSSPPGSCDVVCCPNVRCVCCLGLMEEQYVQHLADTITTYVHQCDLIGMETYSLSIHVPISLSIRRVAMEMAAVKCSPRHLSSVPDTVLSSDQHHIPEGKPNKEWNRMETTTNSHSHTTDPPPALPPDRTANPPRPPALPSGHTADPPPVPPPDCTAGPPPAPPPDHTIDPPPAPPPDCTAGPPPAPPPDHTAGPPPAPPSDCTADPPPAPPLEHTADPPPAPPPDISENNFVKEGLRWKLRKLLESSLFPLRCEFESPLLISVILDHQSSLRDCIGVKKLRPKLFPRPKKRWNTKYQPTPITKVPIERALKVLTEADMIKEGYFLSPVSTPCSHKVDVQHKSVFVAGRYNKYSRKLPQTPWMVDGVRKVETSVQELICPLIMSAFRASDVRFSSSGREDVDVLMLGSGRPFLLELLNPHDISVDNARLQGIEEEVNRTMKEMVAVNQLRRVGKESSILLKQGEEEKRKLYSALVWTEGEMTKESLKVLDNCKELVVRQKTPIRVLHRRTLAVREKMIYSMETKLLDPHHFRLSLVTQAGTYIKEFVHGDFGRTQPNILTLLGHDADILSLDVLEIQLQWPPQQ